MAMLETCVVFTSSHELSLCFQRLGWLVTPATKECREVEQLVTAKGETKATGYGWETHVNNISASLDSICIYNVSTMASCCSGTSAGCVIRGRTRRSKRQQQGDWVLENAADARRDNLT